jgi:magnesium chelatase subunit H
MFERVSSADEPDSLNFIKKHAARLSDDSVERPAARRFSNPPGDYGSMVNTIVGTGDWDDADSLGETWKNRNSFSCGRSKSRDGSPSSTARVEVLDLLIKTTDRAVQEIDSVQYGSTMPIRVR